MKRSFAALASVAVLLVGCQSAASPSPAASSSGSATPGATQPPASPPASVAVITPPPPTPAPKPGHWVEVMADEEPVDSRIALGDGRVLNMTTIDPASPMKAQLWNPATDKDKDTASLPSYRDRFVGLTLADGRALVTGGLNDKQQSFSSTYIFDPAKETWTKSGLLATARTDAVGAVLHDGRVLVAGGYYTNGNKNGSIDGGFVLAAFHGQLADVDIPDYATAMATAEIFDPATGTWSPTGSMKYARSGASAATMADGRVLIFGSIAPGNGIGVDGDAQGTAEVFDPATGRFSLTGPLPPIDAAGLEAKGKVGANPIPTDDATWITGQPVALRDGGAVMIGLLHSWKHVADLSRSVRYDPAANTWSEIGDTWVFVGEPTNDLLYLEGVPNLDGSASATLPDGRVLIAGGSDPVVVKQSPEGYPMVQQPHTAAAQFYDPGADTWSAAPPLPVAQSGSRALTLADGSILVDGGTGCTFDGTEEECVPVGPARYVP
jgi:hypothetical protein